MEGEKASKKKFKTYPIGFVHMDIAEVRTQEGKLYLFVAIDRTSKVAFARLLDKADTAAAVAFLNALVGAIPYKINVVLTDNGIQLPICRRTAKAPPRCCAATPSCGPVSIMASNIG
jgi:transposase-like protein